MTAHATPEQERLAVEMHNAGKNGREIGDAIGLTKSAVSVIFRRLGVEITKTGRPPTCAVDHAAFDVVTPESAYWIGFLFADGCVHFNEGGAPQLCLDLGAKDRAHVEKLRTFLKSTHTVRDVQHRGGGKLQGHELKSRASVSFRVRSQQIADALTKYGMARKSPDRVPSDDVSDSPDFWRGCVDGDGTVRVHVDERRDYRYASYMLYGHMPLLEKHQAFLLRRGIAANITDTASGIYQIRLMAAPAFNAIKLLYEHAPQDAALDRKRETALEILMTHPGN